MSHEGNCYCPNCDRSFDRDGMEAQLSASQAEADRALAEARAEVERLKSGQQYWRIMSERLGSQAATTRHERDRLHVLITHLITAWDNRSVPGYTVSDDVLAEARRVAAERKETT